MPEDAAIAQTLQKINITGVTSLAEAQKATLKAQGAVELAAKIY